MKPALKFLRHPLQQYVRANQAIVYKKTDEWHRVTTSDKETSGTTNDNEWQRMTARNLSTKNQLQINS